MHLEHAPALSWPPDHPAAVAGFREHDPRIQYFVKGAAVQNFGDYLPELLAKEFFLHPRIDADLYRLIGSVIESSWVLRDLRHHVGTRSGRIAYWGCGMRDERPLDARARSMCSFFGVRGPRTCELLGLPESTVLGDPGLLAPLFHVPAPAPATAGRVICIPHIHDPKSDAELLAISGAEAVLRPQIDASEPALRRILDQIAGARFVLTASLHGAIIACAYRVPFAFWDNGHVDIVFKWQDFAGSVGIPCAFVGRADQGQALYDEVLAPALRLPPLTPILDVCPFAIRPQVLVQALMLDGRLGPQATPREVIAALDGLASLRHGAVLALQDASAAHRARRDRLPDLLRRRLGSGIEATKAFIRHTLKIR